MLWLTGGNIYDVEAGAFRRADVAVDNQRIAAIASGAEPATVDRVVDVRGAWLLPGLIDSHVHITMPTDLADPAAAAKRSDAEVALYAAKAAERTLLGGITTARDVGGWNYVEMAVRAAINEGLCNGPRLFLAGRLLSITTGTTDYYPGMYEVANGAEEVRKAARQQLAMGADLVKVMATGAMLSSEHEDARAIQYRLEELRAAVEIAHDNHKHVAAHAHACRGIENAVEAGCDSIEHGSFADEAVLKRMAQKGTFVVPTNCVFPAMLDDANMMGAMPAHLRRRLLDNHDVHTKAIRAAHRLGVRIAMGTDAGTPGNHHGRNARECVLMVTEVGMRPQESIYCAT
ncbi:MAG TPA: amidohydrolase family protein, partial [Candidatus Angelobacter sp.]|nr:amidohydrolase family protein [Candidatus Angelobacter sp.]